jgi:hypothetical protein
MKTLLQILEKAGGYRTGLFLRIENPPYMALVIEAAPELGPLGYAAISVAHYGELNGDSCVIRRCASSCSLTVSHCPGS